MTKLILDVDTGTDDAIAIMLAALHPELELLAVTTVNGNVPIENTTENTLRVLDHIGRSDVPVHRGAAAPLVPPPHGSGRSEASRKIHGEYLDLPAARSAAQTQAAAQFLVEAFPGSGEEVVLVPTGPLTNIALALLIDPGLAQRVKRLILMGGGSREANVTPVAEFNIWADPEAARIVLRAGFPELVVVPLDATHQALVSHDDCERLRGLGTDAGTASAELIETRISGYEQVAPMTIHRSAPVHDALCVAYLLDESVIELRDVHLDVELTGEITRGMTVADFRPIPEHPANARWAAAADRARFVEILLDAFSA